MFNNPTIPKLSENNNKNLNSYSLVYLSQSALPLTKQNHVIETLTETALENSIRKGEYPGDHHFLLSQQFFLLINSLPNNKILDRSKLKAFADDN